MDKMEGRLQSQTSSAGTSRDSSSELYSVFVRLPNEDVAGFRNLPPGISVYDLKARIEIVTGIPSQIYTLHYTNDVDLEDENELRIGMSIMNGATLRMQLFTSWNGLFYSTWNGNIDDTYYSGGVQLISEANFSEGEAVAMHNIVAKRAFVSLFLACHRGHYVLCKVLLSIGADPVGRTPSGRTPLHAAAAQGHLDVLNALLDQGVDVGARDMYGKTPLELSGQFGRRECERRLWLHQWNLRAAKTITDVDTASHGSSGLDTNSGSASSSTLGFIHVQGEKPRHVVRRVFRPSPLQAHHIGSANVWSNSHAPPHQAPQKSVQLPSMSAPVKGVRYGRIRPGTALLGDKSFPDVCRTSTLHSPRVSAGSEDGKRKSTNSASRSTSSLYHKHCQTHASYTPVENYDPQDDFNVDDEDIERLIHVVSLSQPSTPVPPDDTDLVARQKPQQQLRRLRTGDSSRCSRCRIRNETKKPSSPQRAPSRHFVYPETFSVGAKQLHVMMPEMEYDERPITRCHSVPPPSLCSDDEAVDAAIGDDDDIPDIAKPPDANHKPDSINSEDSGRDTMDKTETVDDDEDTNVDKPTEEATSNFVKQREYQVDVDNISEDRPGSNTKGTQCSDEGFSAPQTDPDAETTTDDVPKLQINGVKWDVEKPTLMVAQNETQTERNDCRENAPKRQVRQRSLSADDKLFLPSKPASGVLPRAKTLESWILMKTRQKQGRRERPANEERRRRNVEAYQRWLRTKDQEIREDVTDQSSEPASGDTKENQNAFEQWLKAKRQKAKKERESSAKSPQSSGSNEPIERPKIIDGMSHEEWLRQKAEQGAFPTPDSRFDTIEDDKTVRKKIFTGGLSYEEWLARKLQEETLTNRLLEANKAELEKKAREQRKGIVDKNFREWLKHKAEENQKEYEKFEAESRKAQSKESERRFRNMKRGVTFRNWREQKEQDRIVEFVAMAQQERQERANDEERKRKSQRSFELWLVRKAQENLNEEKKRLEMERRRFLMAAART
ncbi:uncharacterized protein LOC118417073 [Branchiostoma floridae]|uniref:Uncharacterized protein LOC118417073 n=1 Tax=Branchiostoma floridae TaxID=7739 RepID=C3YFK9_BRAFL|nr:uncharacterized protein LOC118417073 [Branchiostoma floridae]|eukprot:XP_002604962.1 hypothetical protein BRAFLDRAFT_92602 [Branchiostoma floridae]